jgi:hypothetical protein
LDKVAVGSTLAVSTGFSIGYVLWLLRGEVLLGSLLASLPAWRLMDPLPVLAFLGKGSKNDGEDDDSIESVVKKGATAPTPKHIPAQHRGSTQIKWRMVRESSDPVQENKP